MSAIQTNGQASSLPTPCSRILSFWGEANIHSCVYSLPMGSSAEENTRNLSANCQAWVSSLRVPPAPLSPGRVPQLTLCACGIKKEETAKLLLTAFFC